MLQDIQTKLKAEKSQLNKFGGYNYRSKEDILEGLKPHLKEHKASLIITDEPVLIGERYYIKSTAVLYDENMKEVASNCGYAREPREQKGMSESQLTGTASSYAGKYALGNLFLIDDTKDADSMDNSQSENNVNNSKLVSDKQVKLIQTRISQLKLDESVVSMLKSHYNIESWKDLPASSMQGLIDWFDKQPT